MSIPTTLPVAPPLPVKRRRWQYAAAFAALVIAIMLGYYFVTGWFADRDLERVLAEIDADDPNWRFDDLRAELKPPPDEVNSAVQLMKASALLKRAGFAPGTAFENSFDRTHHVRNARMTDEQIKLLRDAFARLDPACLPEARKLKDFPDGRFPLDEADNVFEMKLDWLQDTRSLVYLLSHDAMLRSQDGDLEGAAETCLAMIHLVHSINDTPFLIGQLVRIAEHSITFAAIERLLGQKGQLKDETLARLQRALEREATDNTLHMGLRGERAAIQSFFKAVRDGKATFSGTMGMNRPGAAGPDFSARVLDAFPGLMLRGEAEHLRVIHAMTQAAKLEPHLRDEVLEKIHGKVMKSSNITIKLLTPAVHKLSDASKRGLTYLRCAAIGIAAERYRLKNAAWPADLNELVRAQLIKEIPKDPYDGKPLRWALTPGKGVIVYSVGYDKIDNGGKLNRSNPMTKGTDLGFELWPPHARGVAPPVIEEDPASRAP